MLHWPKPGLWIIFHQINQSVWFKISWLGGGWWSSYRRPTIIVNKHLINKFLIELNFMSFLWGVKGGKRGLKRTGRHQMPVWRWRPWAMGSHSRERNVRTRGLGMKKAIKKLANLFFLQSDRRKQTPPPPPPSPHPTRHSCETAVATTCHLVLPGRVFLMLKGMGWMKRDGLV